MKYSSLPMILLIIMIEFVFLSLILSFATNIPDFFLSLVIIHGVGWFAIILVIHGLEEIHRQYQNKKVF